MGKYRIEFTKTAIKILKKLPSKDVKGVLIKIKELSHNPRPAGCRKISDSEKYRLRYRYYRILYMIEDDKVIVYVVKIGHRKTIYR